MSDYSTHNEGVGGRGILIALLVIVAFIVGLAMLGTASAPPDGTAPAAAIETAPATGSETAPVITE